MVTNSFPIRLKACDSFETIAECAQNIVRGNGFADKIKVLKKRSNELTVGSYTADLNRKADLLVAELFDTELIGEGAIQTYKHAVQNLLTPDAILVPMRARIFCQLVESQSLFSYHQFDEEFEVTPKTTIKTPERVSSCDGSNVLHDIQINELKPNKDFTIVSEPQVIFEFQFNDLSTLKSNDKKVVEFKALRDSNGPFVLLMWWSLDMDKEGEIVLTCAPFWTYEPSATAASVPWRDHWMQSVYYFPASHRKRHLKANEVLRVAANRDEYSLWFDLFDQNSLPSDSSPAHCSCGLHLFLSRTRIKMINDISRLRRYHQILESVFSYIKSESIDVLFFGDSSLLPIISARKDRIRKVLCFTRNKQTQEFIESFAECNGLLKKIEVIANYDQIADKSIDLVLSEPYFNTSDLPWNHLHLWYLLNSIPSKLLKNNFHSMPNRAVIKAIPIEFDNLWKIHSEVGSDVEGFDLSLYDRLIQKAMSLADESIESQPLWEYPGKAIAEQPIELFSFDLTKAMPTEPLLRSLVKFDISDRLSQLKTKYISIAFWVEFFYFDRIIENSGPTRAIVGGEYVQWNRHYRQGVTFLPNLDLLQRDRLLTFTAVYDLNEGHISCKLDV